MASTSSTLLRKILFRAFFVACVFLQRSDKSEYIKGSRLRRTRRSEKKSPEKRPVPDETQFQRDLYATLLPHSISLRRYSERPHDSLFISVIGKTRKICIWSCCAIVRLATRFVLKDCSLFNTRDVFDKITL